ncbi:hypothetical protein [Palaeococcus sp. (in: euryarchaeotes)]
MEQEKRTWAFYEKAAEEAEDESVKRVFREFARVEKAHCQFEW